MRQWDQSLCRGHQPLASEVGVKGGKHRPNLVSTDTHSGGLKLSKAHHPGNPTRGLAL